MKKIAFVSWDWKAEGHKEIFKELRRKFGLHIYQDPTFEGSDTYGFIISDVPLTRKEVKHLAYKEMALCEICGCEEEDHSTKKEDGKLKLICRECGQCSEVPL